MDIIDNERNLIKERMKQIKDDMRDVKRPNRHIVIAAGEPVLQEDQDEYRALARMAELLEYGLKEKFTGEYDKLRKETKLEGIDTSISEKISPSISSEEKIDEPVQIVAPSIPVEEQFTIDAESSKIASSKKEIVTPTASKALPEQGTQDTLLNDYVNGQLQDSLYNQDARLAVDPNLESVVVDIVPNKPKDASYFEEIKAHAIDADYKPVDETKNDSPFFGKPTEEETPSFAPNMKSLPSQTADNQGFPSILETNHNQSSDNETNNSTTTDEELIEVESITPWQWVKDHKKQILIGLGLTAITIAIVIAVTQVLPAFLAATQAATEASIAASNATQISSLANSMLSNSALWHTASATEQVALHSANIATSNIISSLTGSVATYNNALGAWTIGGQTISQFAASATATASEAATVAAAAASKVTALSHAVLGTSIGGIGLIGAGHLLPKKKSKEYKTFKASINNLVNAAPSLSKEDRSKTAQTLQNQIKTSQSLSNEEKKILYRKLQVAIKKMDKMKDNVSPMFTSLPDSFNIEDHTIKAA